MPDPRLERCRAPCPAPGPLDPHPHRVQSLAGYPSACRAAQERAGRAAAIYYLLVESCKVNKVNPLTYLTYVLERVRNKIATIQTPDEFTTSNIAHVG